MKSQFLQYIYEEKQSNGTRNMENINSITKGVHRILSLHKISEMYNKQALLTFFVFGLLDPKMFYVSNFGQNTYFP